MAALNILRTDEIECVVFGEIIEISQKTIVDGLLESHVVSVMDTRDKLIREALIRLGWTPPKEKTPDLSTRG